MHYLVKGLEEPLGTIGSARSATDSGVGRRRCAESPSLLGEDSGERIPCAVNVQTAGSLGNIDQFIAHEFVVLFHDPILYAYCQRERVGKRSAISGSRETAAPWLA
jgi:hypothetical protein